MTKPEVILPPWKQRIIQLEPIARQTQGLTNVFAGLPGQVEGEFQPVVDQALHLLNSPAILPLLRDQPSTLVARLTANSDVDRVAEELYLSVLSRRPEMEEIAEIKRMLDSTSDPSQRQDLILSLVWGLLLSSEFRLNH